MGRIAAHRLAAAIALLLAALIGPSGAALALEEILSFKSEITVEESGAVAVRETIVVRAEGSAIRRGIWRTLPLGFSHQLGGIVHSRLSVGGVYRDGVEEPYRIERGGHDRTIWIGDAAILLPPATYTYTIDYTMSDVVVVRREDAELYWNVTGTDWSFPIREARAEIRYPTDRPPTDVSVYTGKPKTQGRDATLTEEDGFVEVRTTRTLESGEGLTVSVSWPAGAIAGKTTLAATLQLLATNVTLVISGLGLIGVMAYYLIAWVRVGRDPEPGTIIPRFEPPDGLSATALRYISRMELDEKGFAVVILSLAVKGLITIEEIGRAFRLVRTDASDDPASPTECAVLTSLFGRGTGGVVEVSETSQKRLKAAVQALSSKLEQEFEGAYFLRNRRFFLVGIAASVLVGGLTALVSDDPATVGAIGLWLSLWGAGTVFLIVRILKLWRHAVSGGLSAVGRVTRALQATITGAFFLLFLFVALGILSTTISFPTLVMLIALVAVNAVFFDLMKAPTARGRLVLDEIDGFKTFIATAEAHVLEALDPRLREPAYYERLLPYAVALDIETEWSAALNRALAASLAERSRPAHAPTWYRGPDRWRAPTDRIVTRLGSSLTSSLGTALSASSGTRSGSGSFGGGSVGGGRGGGGGGGW